MNDKNHWGLFSRWTTNALLVVLIALVNNQGAINKTLITKVNDNNTRIIIIERTIDKLIK